MGWLSSASYSQHRNTYRACFEPWHKENRTQQCPHPQTHRAHAHCSEAFPCHCLPPADKRYRNDKPVSVPLGRELLPTSAPAPGSRRAGGRAALPRRDLQGGAGSEHPWGSWCWLRPEQPRMTLNTEAACPVEWLQ